MIEFLKRLLVNSVKTAFTIVGVTAFTIYLFRFLVYASGRLFGLYLNWQEITLTHDQRFFIHQLADEVAFRGAIVLIIFLLLFPSIRKRFLFF